VPRADVLMLAGLHVPLIPSFDVGGNGGGVEFRHSGPISSNTSEMVLTIETFTETGIAQLPAVGVNV
jgi:hypothetical protein